MNYLAAKNDLARFSSRDITILADYFHIHNDNRNDLLWLLTFKIHSKLSHMPPFSDLENLPTEALIHTATFLDWPTITLLCQTSKNVNHRLCDNEIFWQLFIQQKYPGFEKSKYLTWSGLARELRNIKRLSRSEQVIEAVKRDQLEVVKLLVEYEPHIDDLSVLKMPRLSSAVSDIMLKHSNMLSYAIRHEDVSLAKKLINSGVNVDVLDYGGDTSLIVAVWKKFDSIVALLIAAGADINLAATDGDTPLGLAAVKGYDSITAKLIAAGADVNKVNKNGSTPLIMAAQEGHGSIVTQLITAGADVNSQNTTETTALVWAAQKGYDSILTELITAGADVNYQTTAGTTPLIYAVQKGHDSIVSQLITAKVNVNHANKNGRTALYWAEKKGRDSIVTQLREAGAT